MLFHGGREVEKYLTQIQKSLNSIGETLLAQVNAAKASGADTVVLNPNNLRRDARELIKFSRILRHIDKMAAEMHEGLADEVANIEREIQRL